MSLYLLTSLVYYDLWCLYKVFTILLLEKYIKGVFSIYDGGGLTLKVCQTFTPPLLFWSKVKTP